MIFVTGTHISHRHVQDTGCDSRMSDPCRTGPHQHFRFRVLFLYDIGYSLLHLVANFRCCQDQAIVTVDRALDPAGPGKRIFRTQKYRLDIQKPLCDFLL